MLSVTSFDGTKCLVPGTAQVDMCTIDGVEHTLADLEKPPCIDVGGGVCIGNISIPGPGAGLSHSLFCSTHSADPACDPSPAGRCKTRGGVPSVVTVTNGCVTYEHFGPRDEAAFLTVAAANFDAEDHDHNGIIDANEGKYLCPI